MGSTKSITKVYFGGDLSYKSIILEFLGKDLNINVVEDLVDADLIYWVYGRGPSLNFKNFQFWIRNKQKFILHWIGTDVLTHITKLQSNKIKSLIYHRLWNFLIKRKIKKKSMLCLCCAPWLCDELNQVDITSNYIPLTTIVKNDEVYKERKRAFDFMTYLPQSRMDIYNGELILNLAKDLPEYKFLIIVPDIENLNELKINYSFNNITFHPKVDFHKMKEFYRNSKCFLRFTYHDGLSLSVMEAMLNEMQIYWTYEFPFVQKVDLANVDKLKLSLKKGLEVWSPNSDGKVFVLKELNISKIAVDFKCYFNSFYDNNN